MRGAAGAAWVAQVEDEAYLLMIEFFPPNSRALAQMGLILPRWGLILPRIPPPTPVLYSAFTDPFQGYVHTQNTFNPSKNTPLPGLTLKVCKMN